MDVARAKNSPHLLIQSLEESTSGEIIAAALDGDGDRCLFIVATDDGCRVMDGDEMADCIYVQLMVIGIWLLV